MEDDVLLPGEDPGNSQKGDAEHWISVYQELLDHNRRLLNHMRHLKGGKSVSNSSRPRIDVVETAQDWTGSYGSGA